MNGDFAPLKELVEITDYYEAVLVVSEAHATSDSSKQGQRLTKPYAGRKGILMVKRGKALGAAGARVISFGLSRDFVINRCRQFILATPSPLIAVAVRDALLILWEPEQQCLAI